MPPISSPRTEDVISGGGSFSACLERAIRRPPSPPSTSDKFGCGSLANINEDVAEETTSINGEEEGSATTVNADDLLSQDWSSHHASYHLLQECLAFFSRRRLAVRAAIRSNHNDNTSNNSSNRTISQYQLTALIHNYSKKAPNLNTHVMEYASQRALGTTPPRGYTNNSNKRNNIFTKSLRCGSCFTEEQFMNDEENSFVSDGTGGSYVEMNDNNNHSLPTLPDDIQLTEAEVIKQLSFMERVELSAVLDSEVERAAMFYRHRLAELAPNREDGEVLPKRFHHHGDDATGSGGGGGVGGAEEFNELLGNHQDNDNDILDIVEPSPNRVIDTLSFNDLGSEILELHAFITTNIIVVRQILIRYDAFVRSLGGSPMSSWYQKTRQVRKNGRSSDFRDLTFHSKLKRLTLAYIGEYKQNLESYENEEGFLGSRGGGGMRRRLRFRGFANQFHKLVDAAEDIKKRQRAKWRQPAMNVSAMDFGEGFSSHDVDDDLGVEEGGGRGVETAVAPMERSQTPPLRPAASSDSYLETPMSEKTGAEVVLPSPPLQPPDYASLRLNPDIGEDIEYQVYIFKCVQSKTQRSIEKTYTGRASGVRDNFITTLREYFLLGSALNNLSLMPEYLIMRGKSLKSSLLVVAQWRDARKANLYGIKREPEGINESWFGGFRGIESQPTQRSSSTNTTFSLVLNILSCFLYMMNYYIVGPSSVQYANALGAKDAMSGLIIGAMPWAALVSAVIFSVWSNKSYRSPLLASGVLLISGNILYSSAYRRGSIVMALCGRFLTGLGGPRSMNRRYIADTTPLAYRTAANAAFGTATALGAAVGPATAVLLGNFDFELNLPLYGTLYFNPMTGPGYLMSALWTIYLTLTICMFREPVRSGLLEQVEKERKIDLTNSNIQSLPTIQTYPSEYEMSPLERQNSTVTNYERSESIRTQEVDDCGACPVENRIGFGSDDEASMSASKASSQSKPKDDGSFMSQIRFVANRMTPAVHLCMFLIFSKQFTVENLISGATMVTKNRYGWELMQVGALGTVVGCLTIPISIFVGWISQYREDGVLMVWLITFATLGMALLVDPTDFVSADTDTYNEGNIFAVGPHRYYVGYLLVFCSVQAFDGVVGSVLSKVIPTALAAGTLNSGLLATIVGTLGRALGDAFITGVGYINLRQVQNLLFVPSFVILAFDLVLVLMKRETLTA